LQRTGDYATTRFHHPRDGTREPVSRVETCRQLGEGEGREADEHGPAGRGPLGGTAGRSGKVSGQDGKDQDGIDQAKLEADQRLGQVHPALPATTGALRIE